MSSKVVQVAVFAAVITVVENIIIVASSDARVSHHSEKGKSVIYWFDLLISPPHPYPASSGDPSL